jgi:selenide,water dikinase
LLVLTKPLGVGIVTTAAKNDVDTDGAIRDAIVLMTTLNRSAADAMLEVGVNAATDVTGFGLLGHLRNVAFASGVSATIWAGAVPVLSAARKYVAAGVAPGGTHANHRFLAEHVTYAAGVTKDEELLLADAQTSGGLLIAVARQNADRLVAALERRKTLAAAVVGVIDEGEPGKLRVEKNR